MRRRPIALFAVTAVLLVALSGCGDGADGDSADTHDRHSSQSGDSGNSQAHHASLTANTFGPAIAKAAAKAGSAHLSVRMSNASMEMSITGDVAGFDGDIDDVTMDVRMKLPDGRAAQLRIVDSDVYMRIQGLGIPSKPWARIPLDDADNPLGSLYQSMLTFGDPAMLKASYAAFDQFDYRGVENVDGIYAEHYRVSVNMAKSLHAVGVTDVGGVPAREALKSMPKIMPSDVWVDDDHRIVRIESDNAKFFLLERYSNWGRPVHVSPPPRSQVQDL
jgi:hypothetical protein